MPSATPADASLAPVPCTVVTGFLGAGKTTLIRHLLENARGRRFAVIVNEFGEVGIDGDILRGCGVESCSDDDIVELANGCICCTVADDFQPALDAILARTPRVDHILIETSGLALPKPLVQAFNWPSIRSRVTVDGVIAVADGEALSRGEVAADMAALAAQRAGDDSLDHDDPVEEVFEDQIACADLVILSKADRLAPGEEERLGARLSQGAGRTVRVVPARHGALDPAVLIGLDAAAEAGIESRRTHHDDEEEHEHDEFDSFAVDLDAAASPEALLARVEAACAVPQVLRVKGFAAIEGRPLRYLVQAVGRRVAGHFDRAWAAGETRGTRLVVIGLAGLDRAAIEAALRG